MAGISVAMATRRKLRGANEGVSAEHDRQSDLFRERSPQSFDVQRCLRKVSFNTHRLPTTAASSFPRKVATRVVLS